MRDDDTRLQGDAKAGRRPALGFHLANTHRDDFESWARAAGARCYERDQELSLECAGMPFSELSHASATSRGTLWARFDPNDRLREVTAISRVETSTEAARALEALTRHLADQVGPPHARQGESSDAYLGRGSLTQAAIEYRFSNYYAKVAATNMGANDGYRILQKYRALDD